MTAHTQPVAAFLAAAACALVPVGSAADPIIPNANFSLGNRGFNSSYTYLSSSALPNLTLMYPEGAYTVGSNPGQIHSLWPRFGDHTTGDGNMLIVNGHREADVLVWSTVVDVSPGTQYEFSAWAASIFPKSPSSLAFSINGVLLDAPFNLSSTPGLWQQFTAGWHSGSDTTAVLSLVDRNIVWRGNDFALDDIVLRAMLPPATPQDGPFEPDGGSQQAVPQVPEPVSMLLLGSGLAGLAVLTRSRNTKKAG